MSHRPLIFVLLLCLFVVSASLPACLWSVSGPSTGCGSGMHGHDVAGFRDQGVGMDQGMRMPAAPIGEHPCCTPHTGSQPAEVAPALPRPDLALAHVTVPRPGLTPWNDFTPSASRRVPILPPYRSNPLRI